MTVALINILIGLIKIACVVVVFAYLVSRTTFFREALRKKLNFKNQVLLIILFGALSIFGTYGGVELPSGAIANTRDLGPLVGGMFCGPIVGLGAGLIGGIHRYFLGGFVCVPCAVATVLAGLIGGGIYLMRKGDYIPIWLAAVVPVFVESLHMGITLLLAQPFTQALAVVQEVMFPMIVANAMGSVVFAYIVQNLVIEQRTAAEKEKYRHELERTEYEMETARNIQQGLLPDSPPSIEGFDIAACSLPARQVGGDFFDFIELDNGSYGIVIADVSGKGVPAALFMALSRALVRANVLEENNGVEAIEKANHVIEQESKSGMFVTLLYGVLEKGTTGFKYVNAGHNPPLIYRHATGSHGLAKLAGIALGVLEDIKLKNEEIALAPGDLLLLYTDGITEAVNSAGEQYGMDRLSDVISKSAALPAQAVVEKIKEEVFSFSLGQPQHDDFTCVVVKAMQ